MNDESLIFKLIAKDKYDELKNLLNKNKKFIYVEGVNSQFPIHDACFYGNKNIISVLLKNDNKLLNVLNNQNMNGYHILAKYNPNLLIHFLKSHKPLDIHHINNKGHNILVTYMLYNKLDEDILKNLKKHKCSLLKSKNKNDIFFIIDKKYDYLKIIKKYFDFDVNKLHNNAPISFLTLMNNDLDCLKILIKYGLDLNLSDRSFDNLMSFSIIRQNNIFIDFLLNQNIDESFTDSYENTYFNLSLFNNIELKYQKKFLKITNNLNKQNIFGDTALHIIFKLNKWDEFKDLIVNREVNLNILNKDRKKPLFYFAGNKKKIENEFINLIKDNKKDTINYLSYNTPMHTPFIGSYWLILTSVIYILEKYPNTGFPICKKFKNDLIDRNEVEGNVQEYIYGEIAEDSMCLICGRIYWYDIDNYYISNNLKSCIENIIDKEVIFIYLSIYYDNSSHAGIIIIDNKNKEIERFETYGKSNINLDMDATIKKYFLITMKDITKKKYTYKTPLDFQNIFDFQSISTEHIKYINECQGFCVAWIFWYLEHKLLNPTLDSKKLINKLKVKLLQDDKTILDSIRSYANKLDKNMVNKLLKFKIKKGDIYFLYNKPEIKQNVFKKIFEELLKIQNIK